VQRICNASERAREREREREREARSIRFGGCDRRSVNLDDTFPFSLLRVRVRQASWRANGVINGGGRKTFSKRVSSFGKLKSADA